MEEENRSSFGRIIKEKSDYMIFSNDFNGKTYYKVQIKKKNYDKTELKAYMPIRFAKCEPVQNKTIIRIKSGMEDWYINPKDKYNVIVSFVIFDYDVVSNSEASQQEAINDFYSETTDSDYLPF